MLKDSDWDVRRESVMAFTQLAQQGRYITQYDRKLLNKFPELLQDTIMDVISSLVEMFKDPDSSVSEEAIDAVLHMSQSGKYIASEFNCPE
jgi:hypothetical protein